MADQKYSVEVDFVLNEQAKARIAAGVSSIEQEVRKAQSAAPQTGTTYSSFKKEYAQIQKEMQQLGETQKQVWAAGTKANKEYQKVVGDSTKSVEELAKASIQQAGAEDLQARAVSALRQRASQLRAETTILRRSASDIEMFSRAALVSGTALIGGIFAMANKYVDKANEATAVTALWKKENENIADSTSRIGAVFAREALPFLRQAAGFMRDAAAFLEAHPEVVPAAIRAGEILIGIGVIGKAVASGIRLTADALTIQSAMLRLQAAQMDEDSAVKFLEAAGLMNEAANTQAASGGLKGGAAGAGGFLAFLGEAAVLLGSFVIGLNIADKAFDTLQKHDVTFKDYITEFKQALAIDAKNIGDFFGKNADWSLRPGQQAGPENLGNDWFRKVAEALGLLKRKADDTANSLDNIDLTKVENSQQKDAILKDYEDFLKDERDLQNKYLSDRNKAIESANEEVASENQKYSSGIQKINEQMANSLAKAASDFASSNADAERKYSEQHNQILIDEANDIQKIQQDLRDKLKKLAQDNEDKNAELLAARDAVGLIKQKRAYAEQQKEAQQDAAKNIAERKKQAAQQLADLKNQYEQEKAERATAYAQRVEEIKQQAADQLKELDDQHREEINRIRQQEASKLRELDQQFLEERNRRYQYFIAQIRDLDSNLLGEQKLRNLRQQQMLQDLDNWLVNYRTNLANGLNSALAGNGTKDSGGYVTKGMYRMAWDGQKEFVLSGPTTKAAERLLGSNLSQESIMNALKGNGSNANYYDNRRIDTTPSKEQMDAFTQGAIAAMSKILGA